MKRGVVEVYCGTGKGKTSLAIGKSIRACFEEKSVIIIQFLKGRENGEFTFLQDSALDIRLFRFEKSDSYYEKLSEQEQQEHRKDVRNGLNFARKVIMTHECDVLVLDEILGLPDYGIASCGEISEILRENCSGMHIILTGRNMHDELKPCVDLVTTLETRYMNEAE